MWGEPVPLFSLFKPGEQEGFFLLYAGAYVWLRQLGRESVPGGRALSRRGRVRYTSFRLAFIVASTSSNISAVNRPVLVFWRLT